MIVVRDRHAIEYHHHRRLIDIVDHRIGDEVAIVIVDDRDHRVLQLPALVNEIRHPIDKNGIDILIYPASKTNCSDRDRRRHDERKPKEKKNETPSVGTFFQMNCQLNGLVDVCRNYRSQLVGRYE
jgi:hypothetical protein